MAEDQRLDPVEFRRILLAAPFPAWQWVSINRYTRNLQRALAESGYRPAEGFMPWFNPPSMLYGLRTRYRQRSAALAAHGREPFEIVHVTDHALGHHVPSLGRRAPVVVTCHDLMPFYMPRYYSLPLAPIKKAMITRSIRSMLRADHLVAVSGATKARMVEILDIDPARISVVPNLLRPGLRPIANPREPLAEAGIQLPPGPIVLSIGHTGHYKNLELLVESMALPSLRHATVVRVGARLSSEQRALAATLGTEARIVELGHVSAATLRALYSAASVLALPSRDEGFGIPVIEAMACGLPVVTSDGGALPEVAGKAAIVVPLSGATGCGDDARLFAEALVAVLDSPERVGELRSAGLRRAEMFRAKQVLPLVLHAYREASRAARARL